MNKLIHLFIQFFLIIYPLEVFPQQGWVVKDISSNERLRCIVFAGSDTGFICGSSGKIYRTVNSGNNWIELNTGITDEIYSLSSVNSRLLIAAGNNGKIIRSTDSGENWNIINSGTNNLLRSVDFPDSAHGMICGDSGIVLTSEDSGSSWEISYINLPLQLNSIEFVNSFTGWIAGYGGILKTTNGGNNWFYQFQDGYLVLNDIFFKDVNNGWSGYYDNSTFGPENLRTTDSGLSWINSDAGKNSYCLSLYFINPLTGWSSGYFGNIVNTTDGGVNWNIQNTGSANNLHSIFFIDSLAGWCAGEGGTVLKTTTGGVITNVHSAQLYDIKDRAKLVCYPNPFNGSIKLSYTLPGSSSVNVRLFDLSGKVLSEVNINHQPRGFNELSLNEDFPGFIDLMSSGIYFVTVRAEEYFATGKIVLIK